MSLMPEIEPETRAFNAVGKQLISSTHLNKWSTGLSINKA